MPGGRLGAGRLGDLTLGGPGVGEGAGGLSAGATAALDLAAFAGTPASPPSPTLPGATALLTVLAHAGTPLFDPAGIIPASADPAEVLLVAYAGIPNTRTQPTTGLRGCLQRDFQRPLLKVVMGGHWEVAVVANAGSFVSNPDGTATWIPPFPDMQFARDLVLVPDIDYLGHPIPLIEPDVQSATVRWEVDPSGPRIMEATIKLLSSIGTFSSSDGNRSFHPYLAVQVQMGYRDDAGVEWWDAVFSGWVVGDDEQGWPTTNDVKAMGFLSVAQKPVNKNFSWGKDAQKTGSERAFVKYMLQQAGLTAMNIKGSDEAKIGAKRTVKIAPKWSPLDIISQLDALTLYVTRDGKYGRVERLPLPLTEDDARAAVIAEYADGDPTLPVLPLSTCASTRSNADSVNRVVALGLLPDDPNDGRSYYARHDSLSPWTQTGALVGQSLFLRANADMVESDWLEMDAHCVETVNAHMRLRNKPQRTYSLMVAGNPALIPGKCVRVTYADEHLDAEVLVIRSVQHDAADGHWTTTLSLDAGFGRTGSRLRLSPTARIGVQDISDEGDGYKHVYVTGSWSGDPDTDYLLTYHWFNSHTPYTLDGEEKREYDVIFTPEEWAQHPTIKLVVENTYGLTDYAEVTP